MRVEPIKPLVGARVHVDPARLGDADVAAACLEALDTYGVLVFPKIGITDEQQLAFTDALGGRIDYSKMVDGGKVGVEDVYTVTLNPEVNSQREYVTGTFFWHIDGLHRPTRVLPRATCLSARRIAPKGGDTHFANLYAAYEALPEDIKDEIDGVSVRHSLGKYLSAIVEEPTEEEVARWNSNVENTWPIVWKHKSGRTSMIIGITVYKALGMDLASGLALLRRLEEWAAQPRFVYEHKWEEGDMVVWDNHGVMHRATPYDETSRREMHRTTVAGHEAVPDIRRVAEMA